ncbi:unnamed protein product [Acanthoscelides obtectus]|uniref:Uncharacterized protein n=1 Tax=Acanthoscelides obtectus TaxID=200917 RepID=A0A9P0KGD8_ACAOB|nr:unnamed protein product [Acanthoscelides obtectus]CAK1660881.1 Glypican-5 [Acanthoscelides obtectus]
MAVLSKGPIEDLYRHIRNYIQLNTTSDSLQSHSNPEYIANSVMSFFMELFPLAYHHLAQIADKDFTQSYKECLKKSMDTISPFGDTPKQVAKALSKSLEATRMLLEAFRIGTEVLNTTDSILMDENTKGNTQCHDALLRMTYCPKCQGLWKKEAKPCSGYCLNVLRGCLTKYVAELDLPWNGYVEGIESLLNAMKKPDNEAGVNVDFVIKHLENDISTAIMTYMAASKNIDSKVSVFLLEITTSWTY